VPELLQDLQAVHAGHLDVAEHQVRGFVLDQLDALFASGGEDHLVAGVFERHLERLANLDVVVNDQDACLQRDSVRTVRIAR
jgi:hypothetical protein